MNTFGHNFRLAIWGESHGSEVGVAIDGVPAGLPLAPEDFAGDLARRRAGAAGTTQRREEDLPQIVSGLYRGRTTGAPLTIRFANADVRSGDYAELAEQEASACSEAGRRQELLQIAVECRVTGLRPGAGEPFFDSVESLVAHLLFSVPAVKGVEFGAGFAGARMRGSEYNDRILDAAGRTATNHDGGINGGRPRGNAILFRAAFKPTPSIAREQLTYHFGEQRMLPLRIRGRHDACVALRGAVVAEAAAAIALADLMR